MQNVTNKDAGTVPLLSVIYKTTEPFNEMSEQGKGTEKCHKWGRRNIRAAWQINVYTCQRDCKKKMHLCKCVWALLRCSREFQEHSIKAPSLDLNVKHRQALRRCCVSVRVCMVITVLTPFQLTTNSPQEQSLSCQHGNKDLWGCVSTWHLWWAERCKGTLEKESLEGRKWH